MELSILLDSLSLSLLLPCLLLIIATILVLRLPGSRTSVSGKRCPPLISSRIPWLGAAIAIGKTPLSFLKSAQMKNGDVFSIYAAGKRMTLLMDASDLEVFFSSKSIDFQEAVQMPVLNTAGISKTSFYNHHTLIHDTVKGNLTNHVFQDKYKLLCDTFSRHFDRVLSKKEESLPLFRFVQRVMYTSVVEMFFGRDFAPKQDDEIESFITNFQSFDAEFEPVSQLGSFLFRKWRRTREFLLNLLRNPKQRAEKESILERLMDIVEDDVAANWALLLLWASLANAIPITFWCLAFITHHPEVKKKLQDSIKRSLEESKNGSLSADPLSHLERVPYLKYCVYEAIRLRSPGVIARVVKSPIDVKDYEIPVGDFLMMSPYWTSRDSRVYDEPERFYPDRWEKEEYTSNGFPKRLFGFGGGRYQCPGRWFALNEIQLFLFLFLSKYDCTCQDESLPEQSFEHLVGVPLPEKDVNARFERLV